MEDALVDQLGDRLTIGQEKGGRRGGRGRGGGGARSRGGGGSSKSREVDVSRALSKLLRHQAENAGIQLDAEGYAPLDRVLAWGPIRSMGVTFAEVRAAVDTSDKQRFSMKPRAAAVGGPAPPPSGEQQQEARVESGTSALSSTTDPADWLIRANQGHSIKLESAGLMKPITVEAGNIPPVVVHGTYFAFWPAIEASGGLSRMGRNHVHCSTGLPAGDILSPASPASPSPSSGTSSPAAAAAVISGMRRDAELLIYLDVERSLRDGALTWWLSDNGVVLTEGDAAGLVPAKYFREVVGRKSDVGVMWKDGEKVADLPEGLKIVVPQGKGRGGGGRGGRGRRGDKVTAR